MRPFPRGGTVNETDMGRFSILLTVAAVLSATDAMAQFTVENDTKTKREDIKFEDKVKGIDVNTEYYNAARERAERQRIRKEHNEIEIRLNLNGSMTSYNDPWTKSRGGDNNFTISGSMNMKYVYNNDPFRLTTTASANLGYNRMRVDVEEGVRKGIWFKNLDNFSISTLPERRISSSWSYSANISLRSQFLNSYGSRTKQTSDNVVTGFMAPGYLDVSIGMTYTSPNGKFPIKLSLNPLSTNGTLVFSNKVKNYYEAQNATSYFGVDIDKHILFTGGSSIKITFDRYWGKNNWLRYNTSVESYYGWMTNLGRADKIKAYKNYLIEHEEWVNAGSPEGLEPPAVPNIVALHPTVRWCNTITIAATKFLATTIYYELQYDKAQNTAIQMYSTLSFGLSYTFKNKPAFSYLRW